MCVNSELAESYPHFYRLFGCQKAGRQEVLEKRQSSAIPVNWIFEEGICKGNQLMMIRSVASTGGAGLLSRRSKLRFESQDFLDWSNPSGVFMIQGDPFQVMPDIQTQKIVADKLGAAQTFTLLLIELPTPGQELVGDPFFGDLTIGFLLAEDMPDDDQEMTGNSSDSLVGMHAFLEGFEAFFPVGIAFQASPGDFDHRPTEFFTAFFGDTCTAPAVCAGAYLPRWGGTGECPFATKFDPALM